MVCFDKNIKNKILQTIMKSTNVLLMKIGGGLATINWVEVGKQFSVKDLSEKYSEIKSLSDSNLSKSDRKKIRQELVLHLVNKKSDSLQFENYKQLENFLKLSPELRDYVKTLRDALTGMASMMTPYVDEAITFESWANIVSSREKIKNHSQAKAEAIRQAAMIFKKSQQEWSEKTEEVMKSVTMEGKIDGLTAETLPEKTKVELSLLTDDPEVIASKTRNALDKHKAGEIKKYENNPTSYELPGAK
jgi:hypothetical protein